MKGEDIDARGSWWSRASRKLKWTILVVVVVIIGLALGLGLGLGLTRGSDDDNGDSANSVGEVPDVLPATPESSGIWQPQVGQSWQIVLQDAIILDSNAASVTPNVDVYDIDLFNTPQETIDALHRLGKKVICYFSAGSYEPYRPDSKSFQNGDMGKELDGWPGERWLNLSSTNVRNIISDRIQLAKTKKCDAIDPDNVDGFDNDNGLHLTERDTVGFIALLAREAQRLGLALGLKNAAAVIPSVLPAIQFSVNEQCVQYSDCSDFSAFVNASKPVFHIEYPSEVSSQVKNNFCGDSGDAAGSQGFSTVIKNMNLDGWVEYCNGDQATTHTESRSASR